MAQAKIAFSTGHGALYYYHYLHLKEEKRKTA
jgi:hypothetical protein